MKKVLENEQNAVKLAQNAGNMRTNAGKNERKA